jgi:hypothetical protein
MEEVEVKPEFETGFISHLVPWKFNTTPRNLAHEALILSVEKILPWKPKRCPQLGTYF